MTLSDIQKDTRYWQRLLRLAGYYTGKTDGIVGPLTRAAEAKWIEAARAAKEQYGTFDERSERNIATLVPKAQEIARRWLKAATARARELGVEVRIIDGNRTYAEQDKLYAKRPRVTNAKGGQSWHNFGLAFDFGVFRGKEYLGNSPHYKTQGKLATSIPETTWGGLTSPGAFGISDVMRIAHILLAAFALGCIPAQADYITWDNDTGNSLWDTESSNWYKEEYVEDHWVRYHKTFSPDDVVRFFGEGAGQIILSRQQTTANMMQVSGSADYTISGAADNNGLTLVSLAKAGSGTLTIANMDLVLWGGLNYALQLEGGTLDIAESVRHLSIGTNRLVDLQGGTLLLHGREVNADMEYDFEVNGEVRLDAATIHELQGSGTLVKISDGTLTLRDACRVNNIRLEQGTLCIGDNQVLEDPHTDLELQGGALDLAGFEFESDLTLLYGCTTTINSGTISGLISGSGGLTKVGDGTLVVGYQKYDDDYNRYRGGTVVNGGRLEAAADYAFGDTRQFITVNAGELDLGGYRLLNPVLAKNDTTLHANGAIMGTLAPDACRIDIDGTLSAINVMMQNEVIPTGMDDLQGGGEIRVKKGDTLYLVKEVEDEFEHRSEFQEAASIRVRGDAEHAVLHNVNLFGDFRSMDTALILGASREKSYVDHLDFRSEKGIRLMCLTVGSDCSFTAGNPDTITLNEVTIEISDAFKQLSATEYYFDLTGLFHCDLDMQDVYLDATDLDLNLADATVKLDFGDQVNITNTDRLRLGMKGYDTELTTAQGGTLTFQATVQTPEPATGTLSLLALAALAARRRRK